MNVHYAWTSALQKLLERYSQTSIWISNEQLAVNTGFSDPWPKLIFTVNVFGYRYPSVFYRNLNPTGVEISKANNKLGTQSRHKFGGLDFQGFN